jgi:hypothetical protein
MSGYERAEHHERELDRLDVRDRFGQELDGARTLRFGPLHAVDVTIEQRHEKGRALESELVIARQRIAEIDNSVVIGVIRELSSRFNRAVPKESRVARLV